MDEKEIPEGVPEDKGVLEDEWFRKNVLQNEPNTIGMGLFLRRRTDGHPFLAWSGTPPPGASIRDFEEAETGQMFAQVFAAMIAYKITSVAVGPPPPGFPIEIEDADGRPWGRALLYPSDTWGIRVELFDAEDHKLGGFPPAESAEQGGE